MQTKVRLKDTGEVIYVDAHSERVNDKIVHHYYRSPDSTEEIPREAFDFVPQTCYELFGVECGDGWRGLIQPLFDYIDEYNKDKCDADRIEILQVKEKFGTLRFYTSRMTEELETLISFAESESYRTCELCGSKENIGHTTGWITVCCKDCASKMKNVDWVDHKTKERFHFSNIG